MNGELDVVMLRDTAVTRDGYIASQLAILDNV